MKTLKVRGLVLKEYETGEADKRILLLCKEHGRVMAYARGARKPRSKFMASCQIFTYSDFILAQGRGFFSVTQAEVIESFYNLRTDYDTLCAAHFITDVCAQKLLENINCDAYLLLAIKTLSILAKKTFPHEQITTVFLLKFFDIYGLRPATENCSVCGTEKNKSSKIFFGKDGILCSKHRGNSPQISASAMAAIEYILSSNLSQSFHFEAHPDVLNELKNVTDFILKTME